MGLSWAARGEGKSPATEPIVEAFEAALRAQSSRAPGKAQDRFHLEQSATQACAEDKIRCTGGYLCVQSDEAGNLLCEQAAAAGKTDRSRHMDLQFFLNSAHGGAVSHGNKQLRDQHAALQRKAKHPDDKAVDDKPNMSYINPTNVGMVMLGQSRFSEASGRKDFTIKTRVYPSGFYLRSVGTEARCASDSIGFMRRSLSRSSKRFSRLF